ncbi:MAG: YihY/virulence factor BrkB family protein [Acetobacteraceae bacterium]|nr:YihY/virulence factor BrkB family protein [Acetobacteraceae bacterium]
MRWAWALLRDSVVAFYNDNALSRGAALAYYTAFALAPVLLIAIAVAGLVFGRDAAQGAVVNELSGVMGKESAAALQTLLKGAFHHRGSGWLATALGGLTLLVSATGVFVELQSSLNAIWKTEPAGSTSDIVKAYLLSVGIIAALGILLIVSLLFSAALHAAGAYFAVVSTHLQGVLIAGNVVVSFVLLALLFTAIYRVLPERPIAWRDAGVGAVVTAALFSIGKFAIGFYIGSSAIATSYGSAGSLIVLLVWIYYSTQIFFLGAEFTKVYAWSRGRMLARGQASRG